MRRFNVTGLCLPVLFLFLPALSQTPFLPNAKIEKGTMPLIMEHSDSLFAMRKAGHLFLQGNVKFKHDSVDFRTERAFWNRISDAVHSEGGFDFRYPKGNIKADRGNYTRKNNTAVAEGNAEARDSAGKGAFFGEKIIYNKGTEFMEIPVQPLAHYYFMEKGTLDTLAIRSKTMTYDQREQIAIAADSVLITRRDVIITGDTGIYNQKESFLSLKGTLKCIMSDYTVTGDSMFVKLQDNEVESVLVIQNAHGMQQTAATGGKPAQYSEVFGDTLFLAVKNNKAQNLYVNIEARGLFYEEDLPDYINKMNGDRLDISFDLGKMKLAEVKGNASSLVFNISTNRKVDGKNESRGESIFITFDSTQVSKIKVKGNLASGIYYDMSKGAKE
ncbi:MAG: LptA/OstA family protein [Candidatus Fibromonas sp.]|jgi:lipopolysaccharide export system protein LptA|nr:LptA/OstA family protein [Candidatus Fibromonas sp.]